MDMFGKKIFVLTLENYDLSQYFSELDEIKILSIGCGFAYEVPLLKKVLPKKISLSGIDIKEPMIRMAKKDHPGETFEAGDAINILPRLARGFDLLLILHPEIVHNHDIFSDIFKISKNNLREGGILFVSLYAENEFNLCKELLDNLDYDLIVAEKNQIYLKDSLNARFQYIIIAKK